MNCNVCGKEFEEKDLILKTTDDGAEYYICNECETNGVVLDQTVNRLSSAVFVVIQRAVFILEVKYHAREACLCRIGEGSGQRDGVG